METVRAMPDRFKFLQGFFPDLFQCLRMEIQYIGGKYLKLIVGVNVLYLGFNILLSVFRPEKFGIDFITNLAFMLSLFIASTSFFHYKNKLTSAMLFQVPANQGTKFLANLIWGAIIFPVLLYVSAILAQSFLYLIYSDTFSFDYFMEDFQGLGTKYLMYLVLFSVYYAGSLFFKELEFIKTSVVSLCFSIVFLSVVVKKIVSYMLANAGANFSSMDIVNLSMLFGEKNSIVTISLSICSLIFIVLLLIATFYKFTETEVK